MAMTRKGSSARICRDSVLFTVNIYYTWTQGVPVHLPSHIGCQVASVLGLLLDWLRPEQIL